MTTSTDSTPSTLAPVADEKNLLIVSENEGSSCCGGGSCGTD